MSIRPKRVYTLAPVDSMGCSAIPRGMTHNGSIEVIDLNGNSENDSQDELDPIIDSFANDILNITEADKNPPAKRSSSVKSFLATSDDDDSDDDDDNKASTRLVFSKFLQLETIISKFSIVISFAVRSQAHPPQTVLK